ncbi:MAG: helix-turn-helix domain-containing protein [Rudaea sp.]|nr:helix-turn-helix domain-containing protein [Rudaea sp.]
MPPQVALGPQCADVLTELNRKPCTTLQLNRATGVMRVGAVIHTLRIAGYPIETTLIEAKNRHRERCTVALYTLRRRRGRPRAIKAKARRK